MAKHKFRAKPTEHNGIKFPSKLEAACYQSLITMQKNGHILFFIRQVPFDLPGKSRHMIDFCVFTDEHVIFIEAKGRDLPLGRLKRQQVEELYPIRVHVVKSGLEIHEVVQAYRQ